MIGSSSPGTEQPNKHVEKLSKFSNELVYAEVYGDYNRVRELKKIDPLEIRLTKKQKTNKQKGIEEAEKRFGISMNVYNGRLKKPFSRSELEEFIETDISLSLKINQAEQKYSDYLRRMSTHQLDQPVDFTLKEKLYQNLERAKVELHNLNLERVGRAKPKKILINLNENAVIENLSIQQTIAVRAESLFIEIAFNYELLLNPQNNLGPDLKLEKQIKVDFETYNSKLIRPYKNFNSFVVYLDKLEKLRKELQQAQTNYNKHPEAFSAMLSITNSFDNDLLDLEKLGKKIKQVKSKMEALRKKRAENIKI